LGRISLPKREPARYASDVSHLHIGLLVAPLALWGLLGCGSPSTGLVAGEECLRTAQCGPGLACVLGQCSTDLTMLEMNGMIPDAGVALDGDVVVDAGELDAATGDAGMMDAGMRMDAGMGDAGMMMMDAGMPDAGMRDAGIPPMDAGSADGG
jgi:hypothetical protein